MKNIFLIIALAVCTIGNAQTKATTDKNQTEKKSEKKEAKYCCPKCDYCDTKAGKCPTDNVALVKSGTYYCEADGTTCDKACKCPKCGMDMKKMECKKKDAKKEEPKKP